jgi:site-specific DNA recombinase
MRARVEQGGWPHSAAIGYMKQNKRIVIDPLYGPIVKELLMEFSKGGYNYTDLSELAFSRDIKTKSGKPKTTDQMKRMMCNYIYAGYTVNKLASKPIKGKHTALVSLEVIQRNIDIVHDTIKNYSLHGDDLFPLRRTLLCVICNQTMTGSPVRGHGGSYPLYFCTRKTCTKKATGRSRVSQGVDIVHEDFRKLLGSLKPLDSNVASLYKTIVMRVWNEQFDKSIEAINDLQRRIRRQEEFKSSITKKFIEDKISAEEKALQTDAAESELFELRREFEELSMHKESSEKLVDNAMEFIENPEKFWNHATTPVKKLIQQFIAPNGLPYDFETGFRTPDGIESYLLIRKITPKGDLNTNLVAATGIEPVTLGL